MSEFIDVVGLDPSMSNFGMVRGRLNIVTGTFSIIDIQLTTTAPDNKNKKKVRKNSDDLERARKLQEAMKSFSEHCDLVCVEIPVGSQSARAMASYGMCIGILSSIDVPLIQVTPTEVKLAATHNKLATKADMIKWATELYPKAGWLTRTVKGKQEFTNANEHLADAVAAIHAAVRTEQFTAVRNMLLKLI